VSKATENPTKLFEQRIVYRLLVADEDAPAGSPKKRRVVCTYHNGVKIHGSKHANHPPVLISARDQDEIIWAGAVPFKVSLKRAPDEKGPDDPFFRSQSLWIASEGNDGLWRMSTGPANPAGLNGPVEYKFTVIRLKDGRPDPESEPLDPHIILEP
jgi:hypothetical protein